MSSQLISQQQGMGWRAGCALEHPGREESLQPGSSRAQVWEGTCTHVCVLSLYPSLSCRGGNLLSLVQVDEVSGAQEYWNSGAVPGPLGGEIKTDDL